MRGETQFLLVTPQDLGTTIAVHGITTDGGGCCCRTGSGRALVCHLQGTLAQNLINVWYLILAVIAHQDNHTTLMQGNRLLDQRTDPVVQAFSDHDVLLFFRNFYFLSLSLSLSCILCA